MEYLIYEENMERLTKKLKAIETKCLKYGCEFSFKQTGKVFREVTQEDGSKVTTKFIVVEAEGKAIVSGWEFIGVIDHTEKGNIIKGCSEVEVPERFYTSEAICEHCESNRRRTFTYIVRNTETNEFKQVGKSCLKDFTNGLSASLVAEYVSFFDTLIKGEAPYGSSKRISYIETKRYLRFVCECINKFGYSRTTDSRPTAQRARDYMNVVDGGVHYMMRKEAEEWKAEMEAVQFDYNSEYAIELVEKAITWIADEKASNTYMHNLQVASALEFLCPSNLGIVASLIPTFNRNLEKEAAERARQEALAVDAKLSSHVGTIGERLTIEVVEWVVLTSWETEYGTTRVYKFVDREGNVYTWKTGGWFESCIKIVGTVKSHNEFREVKQTELTRCKVV